MWQPIAAHACTAPVSACLVVVADATGVGGKDRGGERLSQCRDEAVWQWRPWQDRPRTRVAQARHKHQPALLLCIGQNADFRSCSFEVCVFIIKHISSSDVHGCCHWGHRSAHPKHRYRRAVFIRRKVLYKSNTSSAAIVDANSWQCTECCRRAPQSPAHAKEMQAPSLPMISRLCALSCAM